MTSLHVFSGSFVCLALVIAPIPALAGPGLAGPVAGLGLDIGAASTAWLAPAAAPSPEARAAYESGETEYRLGRFEDAAGSFERAYELSGLSDILYNIGLAHLRWYDVDVDIKHLRRAKVVFQNYIIEIQKDPDLGDLEEAESLIAQIDEKIAAANQAGAEVPDEAEQAPADRGPDPGNKLRLGGGISMGVGGALIVGGVVSGVLFGLRGQKIEGDLNAEYDARNELGCAEIDTRDECDEIAARIVDFRAQGQAANSLAIGLGASLSAIGVVGVVVGAVLFVKGNKKTKAWQQGQVSVAPMWSPRGGGLMVSGQF
jgi:tetratricopeptide (TPR) repeat protein